MLTLQDQDYSFLDTSIKETFAAIDRFEWQAIEELRLMQCNRYYLEAGYDNFEDYCEKELTKYGGYRRVRDLLAAKKVIDTLPDELKDKITKPSQTRPLLRLVRTPDKLQEAVEIAAQEKPFPTAADFAKAVQKVTPRAINSNLGNDTIASLPTERTYQKEYAEAIAALKEQHQRELERLEQDLRIGLQIEARTTAEQQVQEQIQALEQLFQEQKQQNIQLQQRLDELENAVQEPFTQQTTKTQEQTIDLRSLAVEQPKENPQECLRLLGLALSQLAIALNNTQALQAAALILGSEPTPSAIAFRAEQLELLPQAVEDIRRVLSKPECSWEEYSAVAAEYEVIRGDYWGELTPQEIELISTLEKITEPPVLNESPVESGSGEIALGSVVSHSDPYCFAYKYRGEVTEDLGDEVWVAWSEWRDKPKKTDRYFKKELRLFESKDL